LPDFRRAVLVTRPEPGASATAARLRALGFEPVLAPLLVVEQLAANLPAPDTVRAVLATSGNAVAALPPAWHALPLLAVGDATAARARDAGFAAVTSAAGDAAALLALVVRLLPPGGAPLLLAAGEGQGEALAAALAAAGYAAIRREVYAARPAQSLPDTVQALLAAERVRAAWVFSAATARTFVRVIGESSAAALGRADALAIGPAAAVALQALPWRSIRIAARPNQDEMLALLR
jgi:uroporphyrinogen-III synthase